MYKITIFLAIILLHSCQERLEVIKDCHRELDPSKKYEYDFVALRECECTSYKNTERNLFAKDPKNYELLLIFDLSICGLESRFQFDSFLERNYNMRSQYFNDTLQNRCVKEICDSLIEVKYGKGAVKRITFEALKYAITNCDNPTRPRFSDSGNEDSE
jgi:hypothetical protein